MQLILGVTDKYLYKVIMTLHGLNDVDDVELMRKSIITSFAILKSESMGNLMKRIPGLHLLLSSLPG